MKVQAVDAVVFVLFLIAVALYAAFLLWCFVPLVRRSKRRWLGWLRVTMGVMLVGANVFPPLAWPFVLPVAGVSVAATEYLFAVVLFPRTLPYFVENVRARSNATAIVIEIAYPIEIAGVRYAPVVRSVCSSRKLLWLEKGVAIHTVDNFTTVTDREFIGQAGDAIIALDQARELCVMAHRGVKEPHATFRPWVYVLRGAADKTQLYRFVNYKGPLAVDDIVLQHPEIVRIEPRPAREVVPLAALWPAERPGERYSRVPAAIRPYRELPGAAHACIQSVSIFGNKESRTDQAGLKRIPEERAAYCRGALDGLQPRSLPRIAPVG